MTQQPIPMPKSSPSASLYVGDLSPDVTEPMLFEIFNQVGPVQSVRVCLDILTRRSLEYAYVNFVNAPDAERALDTLNNSLIKGKPCRIMWQQRDPVFRKSGVGNIFIKNLHPSVGHKELYDTFSAFGNILSCKVEMNEKGESKGYGFVHFEQKEAADRAIEMVNKMTIMEKEVFVGPFIPRRERSRMKELSWTNVYIRNLPGYYTKEQLIELLSPYGTITSAIIKPFTYVRGDKTDKPETVNCSFGFANFESHDQAVLASEKMNGFKVEGQEILCCRAQKRAERQAEMAKKIEKFRQDRLAKYAQTNLYVKHIEEDFTDQQFQELFAPFGKILSCTIMKDPVTKISKGFGFVCYETPEEAQLAIQKLTGNVPPGCKKPLYVAIHETKEARRQKLQLARYSRPFYQQQQPVYPGVYYPPYYHPQQTMMSRGYPNPNRMPNSYATTPAQQPYPNASSQPSQQGPPKRNQRSQIPQRGQQGQPAKQQAPPQQVLPPQQGLPPQQQRQKPVMEMPPQVPQIDFTLQSIAHHPPETQKLHIGERLYPLIQHYQPDLAGKITGMFLDSSWTIEELYSLLLDQTKLRDKVHQAVIVLEKAEVDKGK